MIGSKLINSESNNVPNLLQVYVLISYSVLLKVELRTEAETLRAENKRLTEELAAHALCGQKIKDLEDRCLRAVVSSTKACVFRFKSHAGSNIFLCV
jgi:hypothetical protein